MASTPKLMCLALIFHLPSSLISTIQLILTHPLTEYSLAMLSNIISVINEISWKESLGFLFISQYLIPLLRSPSFYL